MGTQCSGSTIANGCAVRWSSKAGSKQRWGRRWCLDVDGVGALAGSQGQRQAARAVSSNKQACGGRRVQWQACQSSVCRGSVLGGSGWEFRGVKKSNLLPNAAHVTGHALQKPTFSNTASDASAKTRHRSFSAIPLSSNRDHSDGRVQHSPPKHSPARLHTTPPTASPTAPRPIHLGSTGQPAGPHGAAATDWGTGGALLR